MKLIIGIPALGQEETLKKNIDLLIENASEKPQIVVFDNGSNPKISRSRKYDIIRSSTNLGVPEAMSRIMEKYDADWYMMIHSDVSIYEKDWDVKLKQTITELELAGKVPGVIGGFGSLQLGSNNIYQKPYEKTDMMRAYNIAGQKNRLGAEHGYKKFDELYKECITLDGYWLTVRKGLNFWDNAPHHMYDHDICMESIDQGMTNYTINVDHLHEGGVTVCNEDWASDLKMGEDEIHDLAHTEFYEKWKGKLPQSHQDIFFY